MEPATQAKEEAPAAGRPAEREREAHPRILDWASLTKSQFDRIDRASAVVLVTCAPVEVHGPHLPMGADFLEGEALAARMVRHLPPRHRARAFLRLPPIYAATDVVPQPGSLFFRASTTRAVLEDLGATLAAQGFREIVVSNFHGSPRHFLALEDACHRTSRARGIRMVALFSVMLGRLLGGGRSLEDAIGAIPGVARGALAGDLHAGYIETSQLLATHPDLVDPSYRSLARQRVGGREVGFSGGSFSALIRGYRETMRFFERSTYAGAPALAAAEAGERLLEEFGRRAAEAYTEVLDGTLAPADCHSPLWPLRFLFLHPIAIALFNRALGIAPLR